MKKIFLALLIGVVLFLSSCDFYNTSEKQNFSIQKNISNSAEEQIFVDDIFPEDTTQNDNYQEEINKECIVYRTRTGKKYHASGCQYLSQSCIEITLENAEYRHLKPCSVCQP